MRYVGLTAIALAAVACSSESGTFKVFLTDAPLDDATAVKIKVVAVEFVTSEGNGGADDGLTLDPAREVNLLEFTKGKKAELGEVTVEGRINQIRLVIDGTATVEYSDGSTREATVPSGAQTGIKIVTNGIDPSEIESLTLDFDAAKSIVEAGSKLQLKPTIKAFADDTAVGDSEPVQ